MTSGYARYTINVKNKKKASLFRYMAKHRALSRFIIESFYIGFPTLFKRLPAEDQKNPIHIDALNACLEHKIEPKTLEKLSRLVREWQEEWKAGIR